MVPESNADGHDMEARDEARADPPVRQQSDLESSGEAGRHRDPFPERRKQQSPSATEAAEVQLAEGGQLVYEGVPVRPDLVLQRGVPGRVRAPEEELQLPRGVEANTRPGPRSGPPGEGTLGPHEPEAQHRAVQEGDIQGEVTEGWRVHEEVCGGGGGGNVAGQEEEPDGSHQEEEHGEEEEQAWSQPS